MFAYIFGTIIGLAAVAALTKPSEKSLEPYSRQWRNGRSVVDGVRKVTGVVEYRYQDMILFRVATDNQFEYLGIFGAWFKLH